MREEKVDSTGDAGPVTFTNNNGQHANPYQSALKPEKYPLFITWQFSWRLQFLTPDLDRQ